MRAHNTVAQVSCNVCLIFHLERGFFGFWNSEPTTGIRITQHTHRIHIKVICVEKLHESDAAALFGVGDVVRFTCCAQYNWTLLVASQRSDAGP